MYSSDEEDIGSIRKQKRQENLAAIPAPDRRLDSLAELIEVFSGSTCIAVCVLDERILIASNDLYAGSKGRGNRAESTQEIAIKEMYGYFQTIATTGKIPEDSHRREVFKSICQKAKYQSSVTPYYDVLEEETANKLIDAIMNPALPASKTFITELKGKEALAAEGDWIELYSSFRKLEKTLARKHANPEHDKLTSSYFNAFQKEPLILKAEERPGIHAETQILAELYRRQEKSNSTINNTHTFHVGISKLCCLKCQLMLEVANENNEESHFFLVKARGQHDLEVKAWAPPKVSETSLLATVIDEVDHRATQILAAAVIQNKGYKASMYLGHSDSSAHSTPTKSQARPVIEILRAPISEARTALEKQSWVSPKTEEVLPILLDLLNIAAFSTLFEERPIQDADGDFQAISEQLQDTKPTLAKNDLLILLQDETLMGKKVADHFRKIGPKATPAEQQGSILNSLQAQFDAATQPPADEEEDPNTSLPLTLDRDRKRDAATAELSPAAQEEKRLVMGSPH